MVTLAKAIAATVIAYKNCQKTGNSLWADRWAERIRKMEKALPSGGGIDVGTTIDIEKTGPDKIVLVTEFHHQNENGIYDGWTAHEITAKPSFIGEIDLKIGGVNRNGIKEYLSEVYYHALLSNYDDEYTKGEKNDE